MTRLARLVLAAIAAILGPGRPPRASTWVPGYRRRDGRWVRGYWRRW